VISINILIIFLCFLIGKVISAINLNKSVNKICNENKNILLPKTFKLLDSNLEYSLLHADEIRRLQRELEKRNNENKPEQKEKSE